MWGHWHSAMGHTATHLALGGKDPCAWKWLPANGLMLSPSGIVKHTCVSHIPQQVIRMFKQQTRREWSP